MCLRHIVLFVVNNMPIETNSKRLVQKIHIAAKQLGIADDDGDAAHLSSYRNLLKDITGKTSTTKMNLPELQRVMDHLKSCGFKAQKKVGTFPGRPNNINTEPMLQKIEALLTVQRLPWSYADAIAKQMFKIERVAWLKAATQFSAVITALTERAKKSGMDVEEWGR